MTHVDDDSRMRAVDMTADGSAAEPPRQPRDLGWGWSRWAWRTLTSMRTACEKETRHSGRSSEVGHTVGFESLGADEHCLPAANLHRRGRRPSGSLHATYYRA